MFAKREESEAKRTFWSSRKILTLFLMIFGIVLGIVIGHYVVEPILGQQAFQSYVECKSAYSLLDEQVNDCLQQLNECEGGQPS